LSSATRGTVLAGRYRLEERVHTNPDGTLWRAVDATLDRKVSIRVLRPGHPFAADVADAARRAALIDDPRLVRVLDVGSDDDVGFVVSEYVLGDSLAALVERSPLSPPAVRRIVGEVGQGLDGAAARGLHHLRLTPRSVIVCQDGSVKVSGTAVEAAASGLEPDHSATAGRVDALALVGLLYSGLTGRWPLGDAGFPPAPRGEGGIPVPPADLVPGIPKDLDTLCVVTLGSQDDGPRSPAELVQQLAPWQSAKEAPLRAIPRRVPAEGATSAPSAPDKPLTMRSRPASSKTAKSASSKSAAARPAGSKPAGAKPATPAVPDPPAVDPAAASATAGGPTPNAPAAPAARAAAAAAGPQADAEPDKGVGTAAGAAAGKAEPPTTPRRSATLFSTPSVAATGSLPIPNPPPGDAPSRMDNLFTQHTVYPANPAAAPPSSDPTDQPGPTQPASPNQANGEGKKDQAGTRPSSRKAPAKRQPPQSRPGKGQPRGGGPTRDNNSTRGGPGPKDGSNGTANGGPTNGGPTNGRGGSGVPLLPWSGTWSNDPRPPSQLESTGPFPIVIPTEAPPREQSRLVIFTVAAVLILGLGAAAFSLRTLGSPASLTPTDVNTPAPKPAAIAVTTPPATALPQSESTTLAPTPVSAAPLSIAAIRAIDPQGDGDENTRDSPKAVDDDPSTYWASAGYSNAEFGGLKKGLGLALKLKNPVVVKSATLQFLGAGGAVELRAGDTPDVTKSTLVGKAALKRGQVTIKASSAKPAKYVILWFTKLPSVGGKFKIELSEVRLT
jgi:hypothetical protein